MKPARNITFNFPVNLIRRAKIVAVKRGISLNALVQEALAQAIERSDEYSQAGKCLLALSEHGLFDMPGQRWTRDKLYD